MWEGLFSKSLELKILGFSALTRLVDVVEAEAGIFNSNIAGYMRRKIKGFEPKTKLIDMKDSIFYLVYMMVISIISAWKLDEGFHIPIITTGIVLGFYYAIKAIERLGKKP